MGSAQSLVSAEAALTAAVVAGTIGLGYVQLRQKPDTTAQNPAPAPSAAKKGKKKKHSATQSDSVSETKPSEAPPDVISDFPGHFIPSTPTTIDASEDTPAPKRKKGKKKKTKAASEATATLSSADNRSESSAGQTKPKPKRQPSYSAQPTKSLKQSTTSIDTDGSWTRVEPRRRTTREAVSASGEGPSEPQVELANSDAAATTSATGNSSPVAERTEDEDFHQRKGENKRTLAERLPPKPRKTAVDDMLETPDHPSLSRVMRVQPRPDEKPATGFSWADYEDVRVAEPAGTGDDADGEDDGWGVVKSRGRSKLERQPSSQSQPQKAPETLTKRQRQHAQKREAQKGLKAEAEAERLATLANHKKELERARMIEQSSKKDKGGKITSGGMKAVVDEHGKLVWE